MLDKYIGGIPWTSATVQTAIVGALAAWAAYAQGALTLDKAIGATLLALAVIYQRRATESAKTLTVTTNDTSNGSTSTTATLLVLVLCLASCATPSATQGNAGQGGSIQAPPLFMTVNIGTGGGVTTTLTSAPTAAPAATSTAAAEQHATADVKPSAALGDSALKALVPGAAVVPVLGAKEEEKKVGVTTPPVPAPPVVPDHP